MQDKRAIAKTIGKFSKQRRRNFIEKKRKLGGAALNISPLEEGEISEW